MLEDSRIPIDPKDCDHRTLIFGSGDYYIFCHNCNRIWTNTHKDTGLPDPLTANQRKPFFDQSLPRVLIGSTISENINLQQEILTMKKHPIKAALQFLLDHGSDLTVRQLAVLLACAEEDQTVRGLAKRFNVSKPTITRAADRLFELNLLVRKEDKEDRRSVFLCLTSAGKKFAANFE